MNRTFFLVRLHETSIFAFVGLSVASGLHQAGNGINIWHILVFVAVYLALGTFRHRVDLHKYDDRRQRFLKNGQIAFYHYPERKPYLKPLGQGLFTLPNVNRVTAIIKPVDLGFFPRLALIMGFAIASGSLMAGNIALGIYALLGTLVASAAIGWIEEFQTQQRKHQEIDRKLKANEVDKVSGIFEDHTIPWELLPSRPL